VKHIALLTDDRPCWGQISEYLREGNLKVTPFDGGWEPDDVIGLSPDIIITNLLNLSHMKITLRRIPKVAIQVGTEEDYLLPSSKMEWNIWVVEWPVDKNDFLEVTLKQLAVSPRKTYACIFRVFLEGDDAGETAQTVDLSMTGLAFKSISEFERGQKLAISLKLPDESRKLDTQVRITRTEDVDTGDPRTIYGAEYLEPSDHFRRALKKFIHVF
jgi:hypothetical protein